MNIAIIGAGFSGITTAKTLHEFGHQVTVFEQCSDIGGVWSSTRRYPGLATQNPKETYYLSDMPMPDHYPPWPNGAQVQSYLEAYIDKHRLRPYIRLSTKVHHAKPLVNNSGWTLSFAPTSDPRGERMLRLEFDHLIVCNGIFCEPAMPTFPGRLNFEAAGGQMLHSSELGEEKLERFRDKKVLVVGYGRSACDVANSLEQVAETVTLVVRKLIWKLPRKLCGLPYQYILLTRFGESLFEYIRPGPVERFMRGWGSWIRHSLFNSLKSIVTRQLMLHKLGLIPRGPFQEIARSTISLSTEGLYTNIEEGRIIVKRDMTISRLGVDEEGRTAAYLSDGTSIPSDTVICATGFAQHVPFLSPEVQANLMDSEGNWLLYQHILPIGVPNLTFNGYNSSLFSPTTSEIAGLWIAAHLAGKILLPSLAAQRQNVEATLKWLDRHSNGKHAHGTNIVPFSLHVIDDILLDLGVDISPWARFRQWLLPVQPSDFATLGAKLKERHSL